MMDYQSILTFLGGASGLAALLGWWMNRRRVPAEVRLLDIQAHKTEADARQIADEYLLKTLEDSRETIDRLRAERNELKVQIERLLKEQEERHEMANKLYILQMKWAFMEGGMSFEEANGKVIAPLYPMENEASE